MVPPHPVLAFCPAFVRRARARPPDRPARARAQELLAHFCCFDESTFATKLQVPHPRDVPLVQITLATGAAQLERAARLLETVGLSPIESLVYFPHLFGTLGCTTRYGDIVVAALPGTDDEPLRPATFLVKAAVPAGGFSVCVLLEGVLPPSDDAPMTPSPPHRPSDALVRVPDAAVLVVSRQAHWMSTVRRCEQQEALER